VITTTVIVNSATAKRAWAAALPVVAGVWLVVLAGLPLYVFPEVDEVPPSATVLVLGPPMQARLDLAERLRDEGLAERIVVSVQASGGQTAQDLAICQHVGVRCEVADPSTTRGEVLLAGAVSSAARPMIVVSSTPHVARTRYIFAKCYPGEVTVVAAGQPATLSGWAYQYVYQSFAVVKLSLIHISEPTRLRCIA
jgi:hypothetical protein